MIPFGRIWWEGNVLGRTIAYFCVFTRKTITQKAAVITTICTCVRQDHLALFLRFGGYLCVGEFPEACYRVNSYWDLLLKILRPLFWIHSFNQSLHFYSMHVRCYSICGREAASKDRADNIPNICLALWTQMTISCGSAESRLFHLWSSIAVQGQHVRL